MHIRYSNAFAGRNGYGAKLTNIFSKEFIIETVDSKSGYKYIQKWKDNMSVRTDPQVIPLKSKESDYTKVTFKPDLSKFGMQSLTEGDILSLIYRRYECLDIHCVYN
jgi:DNA topoisomerase-2